MVDVVSFVVVLVVVILVVDVVVSLVVGFVVTAEISTFFYNLLEERLKSKICLVYQFQKMKPIQIPQVQSF